MTTIDLAQLSEVCGGKRQSAPPATAIVPPPVDTHAIEQSIRDNKIEANAQMCQVAKGLGANIGVPPGMDCKTWAESMAR